MTKTLGEQQARAPYVSVIVPIYNGASGVIGLLETLRRQDYPIDRFEVVIVDNGSSDGTMDVIQSFGAANPGWPLILETEHDRRGSYAARNKAVTVARGEILAFTDGDCQPVPGWISAGVASIQNTGCDQIAGGIDFYFANDPPNVWECVDSLIHLRQDVYVRDNHFGVTANLFVRADALRQVGAFRDDLKSGGDFEFGQRMRAAGFTIAYAPEAKILHEARASHHEVITKVRRVSGGLDTLASEGQVSTLRPKDLRPRLRVPAGPAVRKASLVRRLMVLAVLNYVHYSRLHARVQARRRREIESR